MQKLAAIFSLVVWFLLAGGRIMAQSPLYYSTSSTSQALNTLDRTTTNGAGGGTTLLTAAGSLGRCTALAVDGLSGKLFLIDGVSNSLWTASTNGGGLTLVKSGLTNYPTDLALDVLNQQIYLTTSSTITNNNTVQRIDYTGNNYVTLFTATGASGNGAVRCTALAVDPARSKLFFADAGANKLWSTSLAGTGLTSLAATGNASPTGVALDTVNQQVYFTVSSTVQSSNTIQRVNYNGTGLLTRYLASGSIQRCTALDFDPVSGTLYFSDAGANSLWRIPPGADGPVLVLSGLPATAKKIRYFSGPTSRPPPGLVGIHLTGTNVVLNATNGFTGGTYYVLTSTNLASPLSQWTSIFTNVLSAGGNFALTASNNFNAGSARRFFILQVQ